MTKCLYEVYTLRIEPCPTLSTVTPHMFRFIVARNEKRRKMVRSTQRHIYKCTDGECWCMCVCVLD